MNNPTWFLFASQPAHPENQKKSVDLYRLLDDCLWLRLDLDLNYINERFPQIASDILSAWSYVLSLKLYKPYVTIFILFFSASIKLLLEGVKIIHFSCVEDQTVT